MPSNHLASQLRVLVYQLHPHCAISTGLSKRVVQKKMLKGCLFFSNINLFAPWGVGPFVVRKIISAYPKGGNGWIVVGVTPLLFRLASAFGASTSPASALHPPKTRVHIFHMFSLLKKNLMKDQYLSTWVRLSRKVSSLLSSVAQKQPTQQPKTGVRFDDGFRILARTAPSGLKVVLGTTASARTW